jgi:hypothetical protein
MSNTDDINRRRAVEVLPGDARVRLELAAPMPLTDGAVTLGHSTERRGDGHLDR